MKRQIINPETSYTFSDYFKLRASTEDILDYFGYSKINESLVLPLSEKEIVNFDVLDARLKEHLIHISLENELTRREFLLAPILSEVRHITQSKLRSEYWFEFNHQLRGSFDYLLKKEKNLVIAEAKQSDLTRGFTQLAVEMIAIDKAEATEKPIIYGAVTTGEEWRFGKLDRQTKTVYQDIRLIVLPTNLEEIMRILIGILED
ncbi:MAG: hypothetical protein LH472_09750 [Pyrinomonadaceae bacterium]|nr:hypothetical protein [Pyrinomonadaceae bacterium]